MTQLLKPASCPTCGSTNRDKLRRCIKIFCSGIEFDGEKYDFVTNAYTTCRDCGQVYAVKIPGRNGKNDKITE